MIRVKECKDATELEKFLNQIGYENVLQVLAGGREYTLTPHIHPVYTVIYKVGA